MQAQAQAQVQFDETLWVGNSAALQSMRETLWTLGDTQLPVLISGSNGTGKSIAAQTIHDSNLDKNRPLVIACCKRWTVGGAISIMDDIWAKAKGGTLFLRNVDTLEPADAHRIKDYWLRAVDHPDSVRLIAGISET
ncbi:MAG: sigma 54-interacting transcriptional regulator, partial [Algicola sp.]|nr:sigma 54-interacting transcriptional regulator [Algicola sp.]